MTVRAPGQGGILEGMNPSKYNPSNPIITFIIQAGIIIIFCRLLHFPLSKIRQPRVIAEVIGGILLGPSVFGRIPGFTQAIFPTASMPTLSTAANIGLILFLFLVGLEVDLRLLVSNWRIALSVGAAGMAIPFGLGWGIAYGLYHQFREDSGLVPITFGTYALFVGVAMAITAFPVLCRILTELKLLETQVGVVVLSAGVGNDVVGWVLLALCVALVNAGSGITALYVLLTAIAYVLLLVYAIRPAFIWILRRTGSLHSGPTQSVVALTVLMTFGSAFFTGIIGIHPIFGAFLMGLICPHEGGFAIKLTEKIEDLVAVFFLPLYFASSGLSTNIGLLNNGITWAYVVGVIAVAFVGKVAGGTLAARLNKLVWRESFTIGILMSCKGLVELIVLNIGLQAKILSQRTFTIFVVMALITTFVTTPLTSALFPPWYQKKLAAWKRGEIDWNDVRLTPTDTSEGESGSTIEKEQSEIKRLLVSLRLDSLPSVFAFVALLSGEKASTAVNAVHPSKRDKGAQADGHRSVARPLEVHGLRMLELTERLSSVMKDAELDDLSARDPVVNAFHTFAQLHNVAVSGEIKLVPEGSYSEILNERASERNSDMILLPWSETGSFSEGVTANMTEVSPGAFSNSSYNQFVANFLDTISCSAAILINNGFGALPREDTQALHRVPTTLSIRSHPILPTAQLVDQSHHIFFPFIGGLDDRVALRFVLRLARNPNVTATIVHVKSTDRASQTADEISGFTATGSTDRGKSATTRSQELISDQDQAFFMAMSDSLSGDLRDRVLFNSIETTQPLRDSVEKARAEVGLTSESTGDLVVVGRHQRTRTAITGHHFTTDNELVQSIGTFAEAMITNHLKASILVIQAGTMVQV